MYTATMLAQAQASNEHGASPDTPFPVSRRCSNNVGPTPPWQGSESWARRQGRWHASGRSELCNTTGEPKQKRDLHVYVYKGWYLKNWKSWFRNFENLDIWLYYSVFGHVIFEKMKFRTWKIENFQKKRKSKTCFCYFECKLRAGMVAIE